ncbi:MAG: glycosyltransferase family 1 protein [Sphingomonadaceae bacterium PASS1]|nr:MAG: glycosyltransferase family 1 protein [Sphingomonadaceae bacterium PASS1]
MTRVLLNASLAESLILFRKDLIADMIANGHEVHVTAPDIATQVYEELVLVGAIPHSVPLESNGFNVIKDLRYARAIYAVITDISAQLVIGYTIKPNIWGSLAAKVAGVKSISMVTGLGFAFIPRKGIVRKMMQKFAQRLYRLATSANSVVIFQNADDRDDFIGAGSLAEPDKARLVNGSGVNIEYFQLSPLPARPVFLMISRYLWTKGLSEYCEAAVRLIQKKIDADFLLVGYASTGPDAVTHEQLQLWQKSGVQFLGKLSDVRPAIASASIYVLPSWREGTPRSVLEAMAMGRPIITTDAPGCRETVVQDYNGTLVPIRDVDALASAMELLANDQQKRAEMGANSRALAVRKYAVGAVNKSYLEYLGLAVPIADIL